MERPIMYKKIKSIIWKELLIAFIIIYVIQMFSTWIFAAELRSFKDVVATDGDYAINHTKIEGSTSRTVMEYDYNFYIKNISGITSIFRSHDGGDVEEGTQGAHFVLAAEKTDKGINYTLAPNDYYVWYRKVGMWNGQYIDLKLTLGEFSLSNEVTDKAYVQFADNLGVYVIGVETLDVKYEFFIHENEITDDSITKKNVNTLLGKNQEPATGIKGFYSFADIDAGQGLVIKDEDKIYQGYVTTNNTYIKYEKVKEGGYFFAGDYIAYEKPYKTWLTILFDAQNSNFLDYTYRFGTQSVTSQTIRAEGRKLIPTELQKPTKSVTDDNQQNVQSNTLTSYQEEFTYNITHSVPVEGKEFYYTKYQLTDTLPEELEVQNVKVVDEDGTNRTGYFDIVTKGNKVTITANANNASKFYDKIYTFKITVKIKEAEYNNHNIRNYEF